KEAAELARIENERNAHRRQAEEEFKGTEQLGAILEAIDEEAYLRKQKLQNESVKQQMEEFQKETQRRRDSVRFTSLESIGEQLAIAGMKLGLPGAPTSPEIRIAQDQLSMLEKINRTL